MLLIPPPADEAGRKLPDCMFDPGLALLPPM
jgi:hypothetical protein